MNPTKSNYKNQYVPLIIFAVAMGFLEAIVVIYIRELFYPNGFHFPLKEVPPRLIAVELVRELCTLLMLGAVAWISGKTFLKRLSSFLFIFGIWDIIYYAALKIFLDWPASLFIWDILFMIPITWVGPVLAPILCAVIMIAMALLFDYLLAKKHLKELQKKELFLLFLGTIIIYFTFTFDFGKLILKGDFLPGFFALAENPDFFKLLTSWEPTHFHWEIFSLGIVVLCIGMFLIFRRSIKNQLI